MTANDSNWLVAYHRFGLGARQGAAASSAEAQSAVLAELSAPDAGLMPAPAMPDTPTLIEAVRVDGQQRKAEQERFTSEQRGRLGMPAPNVAPLLDLSGQSPSTGAMSGVAKAAPGAMSMATMGMGEAGSMMKTPDERPEGAFYRNDAMARIVQANAPAIGYVERLVAFWSNHFCVSAQKNGVGRATAGAFEREAIRPHVLGKFADMLKAVEQHPAMLNYLDNAQSVGPKSNAGIKKRAGLNENLAREILELHTLGVGSGYTQTDVTQFARVLTGWTIVGRDGHLGRPGGFAFNEGAHEPGGATILGRAYAQNGVAQGEAVLADLASSAATARHIARKLVRHFIADEPDADLVARLAAVFGQSNGDLMKLSAALANDEAAWRAPLTKIRNPWELTIAAHRAFAAPLDRPGPTLNALNLLGMPLWQPAGPNGFSDDNAAWATPEGMKMRLELAPELAQAGPHTPAPEALLADILGPNVSTPTRQAIARAETREQAYALLVMSPEFQRR